MAEFGGSLVDDSVESEPAGDGIVTPDPDMSTRTMGDESELDETRPQRQSAEILDA